MVRQTCFGHLYIPSHLGPVGGVVVGVGSIEGKIAKDIAAALGDYVPSKSAASASILGSNTTSKDTSRINAKNTKGPSGLET